MSEEATRSSTTKVQAKGAPKLGAGTFLNVFIFEKTEVIRGNMAKREIKVKEGKMLSLKDFIGFHDDGHNILLALRRKGSDNSSYIRLEGVSKYQFNMACAEFLLRQLRK